jgi:hypothetical protein
MRINEQSLLEKEKQFEDDLAYGEYLRENHIPPSEAELDDMEQVFCKSKILKHKHPVNNLYFQPLKGA